MTHLNQAPYCNLDKIFQDDPECAFGGRSFPSPLDPQRNYKDTNQEYHTKNISARPHDCDGILPESSNSAIKFPTDLLPNHFWNGNPKRVFLATAGRWERRERQIIGEQSAD
jgi:hypothetical protein